MVLQTTYITNCSDARRIGIVPLYSGYPGYRASLDRDGDGIACEPYPF
ncbi:MAG TPA: excalibur calcium-binding domain-containing protein [Microvirga sp.]|nr:excalibur calcium-binding domain-containing protein [Microvirga sp.]